MRFFHGRASILITEAGHSFAQRPQPMQRASSTTEYVPFQTTIAPRGQTSMHAPQATQSAVFTTAWRFDCVAIVSPRLNYTRRKRRKAESR
jgi:hypothetical protein